MTMRHLFAALLAVTCVAGSTPGFALVRAGHGPIGCGGLVGAPAPQMPAFENRIPARFRRRHRHPL